MRTLERIKWSFIALAAVGIILFWVFGFNDNEQFSAYSLFAAGICSFVALIAIGLQALRKRNGFYY